MDDADFVLPDNSDESGVDSYIFIALDRTNRTDTWYPNYAERNGSTEVWDPDTDDDGLTDGQEERWITESKEGESGTRVYLSRDFLSKELNSTNPDSDGDGYWDGWIGVYGVGATENVILYREHLRDEDSNRVDGIVDNEAVPEQADYHELDSSTPAWIGADIDSDQN